MNRPYVEKILNQSSTHFGEPKFGEPNSPKAWCHLVKNPENTFTKRDANQTWCHLKCEAIPEFNAYRPRNTTFLNKSDNMMASTFHLTSCRGSNSLGINPNRLCDHIATIFPFQSSSREEDPYDTVILRRRTEMWISRQRIIGWRCRFYSCMRRRNDDRCLYGVVRWFHMRNIEKKRRHRRCPMSTWLFLVSAPFAKSKLEIQIPIFKLY